MTDLPTLTRQFKSALAKAPAEIHDAGKRVSLFSASPLPALRLPTVKASALNTIDEFADLCGFAEGWKDKGVSGL